MEDPTTGADVRTGDIIPEVAVDRSSRATRGNLYLVWQDARFNGGTADVIAFSRSSDGGTTWSSPVRISNSGGKPAFTPAIAVDEAGTIAVTHYDFRRDTSTAPLDTDAWTVTSTDGGATWSEQHVSGPFDMTNALVARGHFVGDYIGMAVTGGAFHPSGSRRPRRGTIRRCSPRVSPRRIGGTGEGGSPRRSAPPVQPGRSRDARLGIVPPRFGRPFRAAGFP